MEATLTLSNDSFKDFLSSIKALNKFISEAQIKMDINGLRLIQMNASSVCMIDFKINSSSFSDYKIKEDGIINVNTQDFLNLLKNFKEFVKIVITSEDITLKDNKQTYTLKLLDNESKEVKIPELTFKAKIDIDGIKEFFKALKTYSDFSDCVTIEAQKHLLLSSDKNKFLLKEDINLNESVKGKYSLDYLLKLVSLKDFSKLVLNIASDYPLLLDFYSNREISFKFILAPRVDTD